MTVDPASLDPAWPSRDQRAAQSRSHSAQMATLGGRWSQLHHGIDPTRVPIMNRWLPLMWRGGRVLARAGVPPTAVTGAGVVLATAAAVVARPAPWAGAGAVVAAALCDALDGATAVVADRATPSGALADAVADRYCDAAFAVVLHRCGVPAWLAAASGASALAVDTYRRVRRTPARITVAERPTYTVCAALACVTAAITDKRWPLNLCAAVGFGAGVVGLAQLRRPVTGAPR